MDNQSINQSINKSITVLTQSYTLLHPKTHTSYRIIRERKIECIH